jgi:hypothetical protein
VDFGLQQAKLLLLWVCEKCPLASAHPGAVVMAVLKIVKPSHFLMSVTAFSQVIGVSVILKTHLYLRINSMVKEHEVSFLSCAERPFQLGDLPCQLAFKYIFITLSQPAN